MDRNANSLPRLHASARRDRRRGGGIWKQRAAFHVVRKIADHRAASPWAHQRGWEHMSADLDSGATAMTRIISATTSKFSKGMRTQHNVKGARTGTRRFSNVFHKHGGKDPPFFLGIRNGFVPPPKGQHHRSGRSCRSGVGMLDMTPAGRGGEWFPKVKY